MSQAAKGKLPADLWATIVEHAPLVSFDLVARDGEGRVLLGYRTNEPAKNTWFVPGGVVRKGERLVDAYVRVTEAELGVALALDDSVLLGIHEHFYDTNFSEAGDFGTHYVVIVRELPFTGGLDALPDDQHSKFRWLTVDELLAAEDVHAHVKRYFR